MGGFGTPFWTTGALILFLALLIHLIMPNDANESPNDSMSSSIEDEHDFRGYHSGTKGPEFLTTKIVLKVGYQPLLKTSVPI